MIYCLPHRISTQACHAVEKVPVEAGIYCHFCHRACDPFLRNRFLRPLTRYRRKSRGSHRGLLIKECKAKILRHHFVEHWSVNTIASQLGIHHSTVDRVLSQAGLPKIERAISPSIIDPYVPFMIKTLEQYPDTDGRPPLRHGTGARLYRGCQSLQGPCRTAATTTGARGLFAVKNLAG